MPGQIPLGDRDMNEEIAAVLAQAEMEAGRLNRALSPSLAQRSRPASANRQNYELKRFARRLRQLTARLEIQRSRLGAAA